MCAIVGLLIDVNRLVMHVCTYSFQCFSALVTMSTQNTLHIQFIALSGLSTSTVQVYKGRRIRGWYTLILRIGKSHEKVHLNSNFVQRPALHRGPTFSNQHIYASECVAKIYYTSD